MAFVLGMSMISGLGCGAFSVDGFTSLETCDIFNCDGLFFGAFAEDHDEGSEEAAHDDEEDADADHSEEAGIDADTDDDGDHDEVGTDEVADDGLESAAPTEDQAESP